jgi:hypothetical protein
MKSKIAIAFAVVLTGIIALNACKKENNTARPVITLTELGFENSGIGYIGTDLHVEADIEAEGTIDTVTVRIQPVETATWEFEESFTEFSGLKNTTLHTHFEIPADAQAGNYLFYIIVIDKEGNQSSFETGMEIQEPSDDIAPQIVISTAPLTGQGFYNGDTIRITGTVTDDMSLGALYIGLVHVEQGIADADVDEDNTITLLHLDEFIDTSSHSFEGSIVVGVPSDNDETPDPVTWTAGEYYILVKCKDAMGGNWAYSSHYPITISL